MSELTPCEHQVGGWHNGIQSCVLKDVKGGLVLKPLKLNANVTYDPTFDPSTYTPPRKATHATSTQHSGDNCTEEVLIPVCGNELDFYQHLQTSTRADDLTLRPLVPKFHGSRQVTTDDGKVTPHLLLEDLARGMRLPCVVDIKIGQTFAYPGKDHTKKGKKYVTQEDLGFCLTGLRVFHPDTGKLLTELRPNACKQLTQPQVFHSLEVFCQMGHPASCHLRSTVASHLQLIHHWFLNQRSYKIRCGSILVVYDAAALATSPTESESTVNTPGATEPNTLPTLSTTLISKDSKSVNTSAESKTLVNTSAESKTLVNTSAESKTLVNTSAESKTLVNTSAESKTLVNTSAESKTLVNTSAESKTLVNTSAQPKTLVNTSAQSKTLVNTSAQPKTLVNTSAQSKTLVNTSAESQTIVNTSMESQNTVNKIIISQTSEGPVAVKVKMIDFAHVLYSFGEKDENYIYGLENLIKVFCESVMEDTQG